MSCRKPCSECPFARTNQLGPTCGGRFEVDQVLGQVHGPFWLPCHKDAGYRGKRSQPGEVSECAGAAIFRANQHLPYRLPPALLVLAEDTARVFATPEEFVAYHDGLSPGEARTYLREYPVGELLRRELQNRHNQYYPLATT